MSIKHFFSPHPDVSKSLLQRTPVLVPHPRAFRGFSREQRCCFNPPVQFCFTQAPKSSRCQITRPTLIIKFASSSRTCCCMGSDVEPGWCNAVCTAELSAAPFSPAAGTRSSHRREGRREGRMEDASGVVRERFVFGQLLCPALDLPWHGPWNKTSNNDNIYPQ